VALGSEFHYGASQHKGETELLIGLVEHVIFHNAGNGADAVSSRIRSRPISFLSPSGKRLARSVYAQQAGELGGPQSEHTARHRPPVTPANTESA
jgi:hypothetical protein